MLQERWLQEWVEKYILFTSTLAEQMYICVSALDTEGVVYGSDPFL
jgi:hypothetical protein